MTRIVGHIETHALADVMGSLELQQRSVWVAGKKWPQPRLTAWYGPVPYEYSGLRWDACEAPPVVTELREAVEALTGVPFNCCLANYYRDGHDTVGWHADDEALFGPAPAVASLSLGDTRLFVLRRKADHADKLRFDLDHGAVLYMPPGTQAEWQHTLPRVDTHVGPRLNLTFRSAI